MRWLTLLRRPPDFADGPTAERWFAAIAERLLNRTALVVAGVPHRLTEVEVYYHGPGHEDPFAHRDPVQVHPGRWYFHRTAGVYRGGSFKGLDLSFGGGAAYAGVLFRGLVAADGHRVDGPSLLVDRLLMLTGCRTVAELDRTIGERLAWDESAPVTLADDAPRRTEVLRTARVGLALRRFQPRSADPAMRFIFRRYRHLTDPRQTAKGKPHMALALHAAGDTIEAIVARTGASPSAARRYVGWYEEGRAEADPAAYYGRQWTVAEFCRLHGLVDRLTG